MTRYSQVLRVLLATLCLSSLGRAADAENYTPPVEGIHIELNTLSEGEGACRLSFVATNSLEEDISEAIYETVLFDQGGGVMMLTLFDFRDLPVDRPRVRQFDLPGLACAEVGRILVNGANRCVTGGSDSTVCAQQLFLTTRTDVEVLG